MHGRLLACLPAIRWVPHDIPSDGQHRHARSKAFSKKQLKPRVESLKSPIYRRRGTLSITSTRDPELDARTSPQDQSLFFSKLPLELRRMIYELVVGEEVIHLTLAGKGKFEQLSHARKQERRQKAGDVDSGLSHDMSKGVLRSHPHTLQIPYIFSSSRNSPPSPPAADPSTRLNAIRTLRLRWHIRALPYYRRTYSAPKSLSSESRLAYPEDTGLDPCVADYCVITRIERVMRGVD